MRGTKRGTNNLNDHRRRKFCREIRCDQYSEQDRGSLGRHQGGRERHHPANDLRHPNLFDESHARRVPHVRSSARRKFRDEGTNLEEILPHESRTRPSMRTSRRAVAWVTWAGKRQRLPVHRSIRKPGEETCGLFHKLITRTRHPEKSPRL